LQGSNAPKKGRNMANTQHPWQVGPTELIEFALERMHKGSDFDRRLAFLVLDVGVETLIKTVLILPDSVTGAQTSFSARNKAAQENSFHSIVQALKDALPGKANQTDFSHIQYYHGIRNTLYHQGDTVVTVPISQLEGYAKLAVKSLKLYLDVDLSQNLIPPVIPSKAADDPIVDSVEVEISSGRYRIERRKSQTICVYSLQTDAIVDPVKPFLRKVIEELSLPVELNLSSGSEKNTRMLGREVIDELKPTSWHGWVAGQKVRRDTLISLLTGRIREGAANEKKWSKVDYLRSLKDEYLVFQPTGKNYGNSPFNLKCWETLDGKPIKEE
jgi:hypothetical protein